ncbi:MAG: alpha/beta hydrolase [Bacteroidetes bacterium]|nr:alpha/beta hydrolase [Bacteroidota bacterium]
MQHHISFNYQARYFTLGTPGHTSWLVTHGYGQLASYFIRHFQPLADLGHYIVAPEGLSRFYLSGNSGRVGASWMTREERLSDISNYLHYLDAVAEASQLANATNINLLGFSQGVATISRWAMHTPLKFSKLVLWAGVFPPDLSLSLSSARLQHTSIYQAYGTEDPYLADEKVNEQQTYLQSLNPGHFQRITFQGAHTMDGPTLLKIADNK